MHFNTKKENLHGQSTITNEHVKNNSKVRNLLVDSGIVPENLPPEEDIKKLERKIKKDEKKLAKN